MNIHKIGTMEAICLICIVMTNHIIINIPETIIQASGPSAWLNVIFVSLIVLGFTLLICKLFENFSGKDILDLSEYVGGKWLKIIIGIAFIVLFSLISSTLLKFFCSRFAINIFS